MTLTEMVEDAFLDCLEQGANPPREFTVRLSWDWFADLGIIGTQLRVAGFVITLALGNPDDPPMSFTH